MRTFMALVVVTLMAASTASAQDRRVHFTIGGGVTTPVSDVSDRFGTGGNFQVGVVFDVNDVFAVQGEYAFNRLGGEDRVLQGIATPASAATPILIESHHNMQYLSFNSIFRPAGDSALKPYGIGGFGFYYREVSLTTPDVGFTTVCDPWWYVCFPAAVPVDQIIGERSTWDPGISLGGGVSFRIGESSEFYVETRWHYMWGPEFTDLDGNTQKANGQYFPVTFGFRF